MKKKTITTTWKLANKRAKVFYDIISYCECPYCKRIILQSTPELCENLKKWRKQKPLKSKCKKKIK